MFTFRRLRPVVGASGAAVLVFLASGLIHELVISVPARGGYGLPTGYFLIQGVAVAGERTQVGRRLGLGRGWRGWLFTAVVVAAPAFWLFLRRSSTTSSCRCSRSFEESSVASQKFVVHRGRRGARLARREE